MVKISTLKNWNSTAYNLLFGCVVSLGLPVGEASPKNMIMTSHEGVSSKKLSSVSHQNSFLGRWISAILRNSIATRWLSELIPTLIRASDWRGRSQKPKSRMFHTEMPNANWLVGPQQHAAAHFISCPSNHESYVFVQTFHKQQRNPAACYAHQISDPHQKPQQSWVAWRWLVQWEVLGGEWAHDEINPSRERLTMQMDWPWL